MKGEQITRLMTMNRLVELSGLHHQTIKDAISGEDNPTRNTIKKLKAGLDEAEKELRIAIKDLQYLKKKL